MIYHDFERCYAAVTAKDPRFDGWFYTAVSSTKIYCRPGCPARAPKAENVTFYPTAAACQATGHRACKRCRPDASPGSPEWNLRGDVAARALRLIEEGLVDRAGVQGLAEALSYSQRQLERILKDELGAGPLALARAQRAQNAALLIETSGLTMTEIAFAAGFSSVRQFNATVQEVFDRTPSELRAARRVPSSFETKPGWLQLDLKYRSPLSAHSLLRQLRAGIWSGIDAIGDTDYRCATQLAHGLARFRFEFDGETLGCSVALDDLRDLPAASAQCRWLLDLDTDTTRIDAAFGGEPGLRDVFRSQPTQRVLRCLDRTEQAIRLLVRAAPIDAASLALVENSIAALVETSSVDGVAPFPSLKLLGPLTHHLPSEVGRPLNKLVSLVESGIVDFGSGTNRGEALRALRDQPELPNSFVGQVARRIFGDPDVASPDLDRVKSPELVVAIHSIHRGLGRPWRSYASEYLLAMSHFRQ